MTRWPGDVVDCAHPLGVKYMAEGSCRRSCHEDPLCNGYGMWHGKSEDGKANGIENGDFEALAFDAQFITIATEGKENFGWEVLSGNVDVVRATDETVRDMPGGEKILDLNGDRPGKISQVVNTRVGQKYLLSFYASGNYECSGQASKTMNVYWSGCSNGCKGPPAAAGLYSD